MTNSALFRLGFVFIVCLTGCITKNNVQAQSLKKNWGIRLGLNAISITNYKVFQDGEILTNASYTNKNGYLIAGFARVTFNRFFLQPEIAWNEYRRTCSFSLPIENSTNYYSPTDLYICSKAATTGLLAGYNIVSDLPFLFGVYAGSDFIGTYHTDYSMDPEKTFTKTDWMLNYSGILGFSINISRIYFDLRYEMCLPNANLTLSDISDFSEFYQNVKIKKTESVLSFSCGVMF